METGVRFDGGKQHIGLFVICAGTDFFTLATATTSSVRTVLPLPIRPLSQAAYLQILAEWWRRRFPSDPEGWQGQNAAALRAIIPLLLLPRAIEFLLDRVADCRKTFSIGDFPSLLQATRYDFWNHWWTKGNALLAAPGPHVALLGCPSSLATLCKPQLDYAESFGVLAGSGGVYNRRYTLPPHLVNSLAPALFSTDEWGYWIRLYASSGDLTSLAFKRRVSLWLLARLRALAAAVGALKPKAGSVARLNTQLWLGESAWLSPNFPKCVTRRVRCIVGVSSLVRLA